MSADRGEVFTVDQVREKLKVSRSTMFNPVASKKIKSVKIGRSRRIPIEAYNDYIRRLEIESS